MIGNSVSEFVPFLLQESPGPKVSPGLPVSELGWPPLPLLPCPKPAVSPPPRTTTTVATPVSRNVAAGPPPLLTPSPHQSSTPLAKPNTPSSRVVTPSPPPLPTSSPPLLAASPPRESVAERSSLVENGGPNGPSSTKDGSSSSHVRRSVAKFKAASGKGTDGVGTVWT